MSKQKMEKIGPQIRINDHMIEKYIRSYFINQNEMSKLCDQIDLIYERDLMQQMAGDNVKFVHKCKQTK